jgi:hypothetical protein
VTERNDDKSNTTEDVTIANEFRIISITAALTSIIIILFVIMVLSLIVRNFHPRPTKDSILLSTCEN